MMDGMGWICDCLYCMYREFWDGGYCYCYYYLLDDSMDRVLNSLNITDWIDWID